MKKRTEKKRVNGLRNAGIAVCDGTCAECIRKICTGAREIGKREEVRGEK